MQDTKNVLNVKMALSSDRFKKFLSKHMDSKYIDAFIYHNTELIAEWFYGYEHSTAKNLIHILNVWNLPKDIKHNFNMELHAAISGMQKVSPKVEEVLRSDTIQKMFMNYVNTDDIEMFTDTVKGYLAEYINRIALGLEIPYEISYNLSDVLLLYITSFRLHDFKEEFVEKVKEVLKIK